jgi:hypothetical protein
MKYKYFWYRSLLLTYSQITVWSAWLTPRIINVKVMPHCKQCLSLLLLLNISLNLHILFLNIQENVKLDIEIVPVHFWLRYYYYYVLHIYAHYGHITNLPTVRVYAVLLLLYNRSLNSLYQILRKKCLPLVKYCTIHSTNFKNFLRVLLNSDENWDKK